ncbi:glutamate-rich protein 6 [Amia ocellicauda]|uniref:glutamate-rich protein 6 n=1 Tax=Amia ocellicauda TaxID=2972642 RepID=UPI0034644540
MEDDNQTAQNYTPLSDCEERSPPNVGQEENTVEQQPNSQGFPRIFRGFSREQTCPPSPVSSENSSSEAALITQPEGDWLQDHGPLDTDSVSSCSDQELKEMGIFTDMQLNEEFLHLLQQPLLPGVGMPAILSYKQESRDRPTDPRTVPPQPPQTGSPTACEFCGKKMKPFPTADQIRKGQASEIFCCPQYQHLYEFLVQERAAILERQERDKASVVLHPPDEDMEERERAKERAAQRLQERALEKYYQTADLNDSIPNSYSKSMNTISYQLSSCAPRDGSWTVKQEVVDEEETEPEEDSLFTFEEDFTITQRKESIQFTEKYYTNGNKFLTAFPDGSAQVLYPSGNMAVLIIVNEKNEFAAIVQEDKAEAAAIQAVFKSKGKATCYHPNGNVWLSINVFGGLCSDEHGNKLKTWRWSGALPSDRPAPFRPIFLSLNQRVGVRVLAQQKIFISFLAMGQQAKFNVGTNIQCKEAKAVLPPYPLISQDDLFLLAGRIKLHTTLHKLHNCLRFPTNTHLQRAKPPLHLISLSRKLLSLCESLKMEAAETAFIKASVKDCLG